MTHRTITRDKLYELVWSSPMTELAKDFGLSDRGLAKLCERNSVPVPPRGYWAKKVAGKPSKKPPLVKLDTEPSRLIAIKGNADQSSPTEYDHQFRMLSENLKERVRQEADPTNKILSDESLSDPFPAVAAWIRLDGGKPKDKKVLPSTPFDFKNRPNTFQIKTKHRRRIILNSLLKALEQRGLLVTVKSEADWIAVSDKFNTIDFNIEEWGRQYRRDLTEDEKKLNFFTPDKSWKYALEPTGDLRLRIKSKCGIDKIIRETTRENLEQRLNEVVSFIYKALYKERTRSLKLEKYEKDLQAEHARKEQRKADDLFETRRREDLEIKITNWSKAKRIREYVAAIEKSKSISSSAASASDFFAWKSWAIKYADKLEAYEA